MLPPSWEHGPGALKKVFEKGDVKKFDSVGNA